MKMLRRLLWQSLLLAFCILLADVALMRGRDALLFELKSIGVRQAVMVLERHEVWRHNSGKVGDAVATTYRGIWYVSNEKERETIREYIHIVRSASVHSVSPLMESVRHSVEE